MRAEEAYSVDGLDPLWGGVVAHFVSYRAQHCEPIYGEVGEYQRSLEESGSTDKFLIHAKLYSQALWKWCNHDVPEHIDNWVHGRGGYGPKAHPIDRLNYLIFRREAMEWWVYRGRTQKTKEDISDDAVKFMGHVENLELAVAVCDIKLFKCLVTESRQSRSSMVDLNAPYWLMNYWMMWSLWKGGYEPMVTEFKSRLNVTVSSSTLRKFIKRLELRPK